MSLRVSFELDESDLQHFRLIMRAARKAAARHAAEDIVASAEELLADIGESGAPGFVLERLAKLRLLIRMLTDLEWRLPYKDATRVLNALAYFTETEDLIPDHVPGLGFLDDAIMIELVARELRHEIDAYEDFCAFRDQRRLEKGRKPRMNREKWLEKRREDLQSRMHRRRARDLQDAEGSGPGLFDPG